MVATIVKSPCATSTTLSIIEAYDQLDELKATMKELESNPSKERQQTLMQQAGESLADLMGNDLETSETESEIELNLALIKFKHTIKRKKK